MSLIKMFIKLHMRVDYMAGNIIKVSFPLCVSVVTMLCNVVHERKKKEKKELEVSENVLYSC